MAQITANRVGMVKSRIEHLLQLTERAYDLCEHWHEDLHKALDVAGERLNSALRFLDALPEGYVPPRKPAERKYTQIKAGDSVRLTEKSASRYMAKLRGQTLKVVSITDGWAEVQLDGDPQKPTVEVKHLVASSS